MVFKMKKLSLAVCLLTLFVSAFYGQKQDAQVTKVALSPAEVQKIIKSFSDQEAIFRRALNNYSFKRDAIIQTIGFGAGQITGEYHRTSVFTFDDSGKKYEKILFFPMPTITEITVTPSDLEDLGGVNPFALEPDKISFYNVTFIGKQKIDELDLYVFDVAPKVMPDPKSGLRLFQGRVWIDDQDLHIVKSMGKGVPEDKNSKYPTVETWRENIGGKYWFPTFATSNQELLFDNGQTVRFKMRVRYTDYKEASATVRVLDEDETEENPKPSPTPAPAKKP
jgi:hypothetical protein